MSVYFRSLIFGKRGSMFQELVHKADLGNGYYQNPILDGDYADPAVFREGENYYLTASTGPYYPVYQIL